MIHRQEKRSLFGFNVSRHIDLEDAQTIIAAIKETPKDRPIDLILHTPGGLVLAAMQIARAVEAHPAKVTVFVPVYAMSGGTLIALAADEIVLGEFSVLGPIDPQIAGLPAASIVRARNAKPIEHVFDLTLVLADVSEKALAQVQRGAVELLTPRMEHNSASNSVVRNDPPVRCNAPRTARSGPYRHIDPDPGENARLKRTLRAAQRRAPG